MNLIEDSRTSNNNAIIFSLKNQVTGLVRALRVFQVMKVFIQAWSFIQTSLLYFLFIQEFNINVRHIESRKSRRKTSQYEIYVDIDCKDKEKMNLLLHHLRYFANFISIHFIIHYSINQFNQTNKLNKPKTWSGLYNIRGIWTIGKFAQS